MAGDIVVHYKHIKQKTHFSLAGFIPFLYLCAIKINLTMAKLSFKLIFITLALAALGSCEQKKQNNNFESAEGYNKADSIISATSDGRNWSHFLTVVDSFEQAGDISRVKGIFYKTVAYNLMGQYRASQKLYNKLSDISVNELLTEADLESYIYSSKDYVRMLCDMRRYDRALRQARNADRKLKAAGYHTFTDHQDIAQMIGECQLCLGQNAEAMQNFDKSLAAIKERLKTNNGDLDLRECQKTMNAIATVYMRRNQFNEAMPWILRQDTLYAQAQKLPHPDSVYLDEMKAEISYTRAMQAHATGRYEDAEKAFADYSSTATSKQSGSLINSCRYLMATHRYNEAAQNMTQLDKFMSESAYEEADLENIGRFMIPKFHVNLLAGHRDSALAVATQIANVYDSALIRQKIIDADLLATVYDTEGKERQIAEQRAELSQQRMLWVLGVGLVFIILLHLHLVQRRKAYKKLSDTNKQLIEANERAEESERMKSKFIHQISHEVRTPLNVLSGFTQVLAAPDIEISAEELQSISKKIVENSERITRLVDKMLDLSLVNAHSSNECTDKVSPADIAYQAAQQAGITQATHLDFNLKLGARTSQVIMTTHLKSAVKALVLLLDNAQKFTHPLAYKGKAPEGKASVVLNVNIDDQKVIFSVEDTGIGVPADQAENIFTEFVQLDEYTDGTGIGLSIARSLARNIKGDIVLDTTYTVGARFVMQLPL